MAGTMFEENLSPYLTLVESATPGSPAAGNRRLVVGTDHVLRWKDSAGLVSPMVALNKWDGTTAPTVNEDSGDGYAVGSRWIDTTNDKEYVCLDASVGAAVWLETTPAVAVPTKCGAQAYNSGTQNVNNTAAALTLDSEVYDTDAFHDTGSNTSRMTIPAGKDGLYLCTANSFHSAAGVSWYQFRIGGAVARGTGGLEPDQSSGYGSIAAQFDLVAGNYVELWVGTAASVNFGHASALDAQTTFTITRIAD